MRAGRSALRANITTSRTRRTSISVLRGTSYYPVLQHWSTVCARPRRGAETSRQCYRVRAEERGSRSVVDLVGSLTDSPVRMQAKSMLASVRQAPAVTHCSGRSMTAAETLAVRACPSLSMSGSLSIPQIDDIHPFPYTYIYIIASLELFSACHFSRVCPRAA